MWCQDNVKEGLKAYRTGFGWGVLIGVFSWLVTGKPIYSLPIVLGLVLGAFAFQLRIKQIEKHKSDD